MKLGEELGVLKRGRGGKKTSQCWIGVGVQNSEVEGEKKIKKSGGRNIIGEVDANSHKIICYILLKTRIGIHCLMLNFKRRIEILNSFFFLTYRKWKGVTSGKEMSVKLQRWWGKWENGKKWEVVKEK